MPSLIPSETYWANKAGVMLRLINTGNNFFILVY